MYTNKDLKIAVKNLAKDGLTLELVEGKGGDCVFTLKSKNYKTVIGCNDLGFWLIKQERKGK